MKPGAGAAYASKKAGAREGAVATAAERGQQGDAGSMVMMEEEDARAIELGRGVGRHTVRTRRQGRERVFRGRSQ